MRKERQVIRNKIDALGEIECLHYVRGFGYVDTTEESRDELYTKLAETYGLTLDEFLAREYEREVIDYGVLDLSVYGEETYDDCDYLEPSFY